MLPLIKITIQLLIKSLPELEICVLSFLENKDGVLVTIQNQQTGYTIKLKRTSIVGVLNEDKSLAIMSNENNLVGAMPKEVSGFLAEGEQHFSFNADFIEMQFFNSHATFYNNQSESISIEKFVEKQGDNQVLGIIGLVDITTDVVLNELNIPSGKYAIYETDISDELLLENLSDDPDEIDSIINYSDLESIYLLFADTLIEMSEHHEKI